MQHDTFVPEPPIMPLRDCAPEIQAMFGYKAPRRAAAVTRDGRKLMEAHQARKFFDRELEMKRDWIKQIEEGNKARWN